MELSRDGRHIVVQNERGLSIIDLRHPHEPTQIDVARLHAYSVVDDELWVVAGDPATVTIHAMTGRVLAQASVGAPGPAPRLLRAAGGKLACWIGTPVAVISHDRKLAVTELRDDVDLALAISSTRVLLATRQRLTLQEQGGARWTVATAAFGPISDASLVLDGKAVALTAGAASNRSIVVVGLRDGAILHRITLGSARSIRYAASRGVALVQAAESRLLLIDLRFGRVLIDHTDTRAIVEAIIDDHGRDIALRLAEAPDDVVHVGVSELQRAAVSAPNPLPPPEPAATSEDVAPAEDAEPAPAWTDLPPPFDPFTAGGQEITCPALRPRSRHERTTPAQTRALDARCRELAIAMTSLAIAKAWDEGRLSYPQSAGLPFLSEVTGMTSGQRGLAIEEVEKARLVLDKALRATADARTTVSPRLAPLDALADELGLSAVERDVLLLVAAPSLWGETARLFGILSNDEGRPLVDEQLLGDLLRGRADRLQIARALDEDSPLVRHGVVIVHAGSMRPFLPLLVDPVVLKLLRGAGVESELAPQVQTLDPTRTFEELRIPTRVKHQLVGDLARASAPLRIVIRGRVGSGRHTLLATIAARSGYKLGIVDATTAIRDPRRFGELATALNRAHLAGLLPCIDGLELIASHDVVLRDQVRETIRRHAGPLAVRLPPETPPPMDPNHVLIDLPALSLSDRLACWERTLVRQALVVSQIDELADRYAVGPGVIERVAAEVARHHQQEPDAGPRLESGIRQHLESRLGASANRVTRLATWEQVILPSDIQDSLTELIARIKHRRIVYDTWGFDRVMSTSRGVTALFQGSPGTGKTLVASAIANELGMDLYRVDLSRVMSKWIGETEQNLAKLFDAAEDGNTIILFDEADSLFAKRTEVKSSVDRYANLEVNYLLQRIDTFEGIAILTTNFGTSIDSAFKRRLSLRLTFPFPDEDIREQLWRSHLPAALPIAGPLDFADLARRYQMSGGYIRNATLRAAFLAAEEHGPLTQDHLERAIKAEFREIGKIAESGVLE